MRTTTRKVDTIIFTNEDITHHISIVGKSSGTSVFLITKICPSSGGIWSHSFTITERNELEMYMRNIGVCDNIPDILQNLENMYNIK